MTVVDFDCPRCSAHCVHTARGEVVRCPHCFSFVTVPEGEPPQAKAAVAEPATIVFACTHCKTRIETDQANAGLACLCPGCHVGLTVPGNARPIFLRPAPTSASLLRRPIFDSVMATLLLAVLAVSALLVILGLTSRPAP
jgi:DNA-directed RNA polymerase subunit RPC12/RpoP